MKMKVVAINRVNRSGTSKSGMPYHIDQTNITVEVPFSSPEGFGFKHTVYPYGESKNFDKLEQYRSKLPLEMEIELGVEINKYESPITTIVGINPINSGLAK